MGPVQLLADWKTSFLGFVEDTPSIAFAFMVFI